MSRIRTPRLEPRLTPHPDIFRNRKGELSPARQQELLQMADAALLRLYEHGTVLVALAALLEDRREPDGGDGAIADGLALLLRQAAKAIDDSRKDVLSLYNYASDVRSRPPAAIRGRCSRPGEGRDG